MTLDALLRSAIFIAMGLGALYAIVGGLMTRVGGRWRDGDRIIELRQFGPLISGDASRPGGWERYSGFAIWGRIRLTRRDGGLDYLKSLGFSAEVAPLIDDSVMASFDLRLNGSLLEGTMQGRVIRSERHPPRIISVGRTPSKPRTWTRA